MIIEIILVGAMLFLIFIIFKILWSHREVLQNLRQGLGYDADDLEGFGQLPSVSINHRKIVGDMPVEEHSITVSSPSVGDSLVHVAFAKAISEGKDLNSVKHIAVQYQKFMEELIQDETNKIKEHK